MNIPIRNLFYLLSYVWNVDWEMEWSSLDAEKSEDALNLLARILVTSTDRIVRRGLDRGYKEFKEDLYGVRGRIDISNTIKKNGFANRKLTCEHEEFNHSILHNQIIKSSLINLSKVNGLDKELRQEVQDLIHRLRDVELTELNQNIFSKVRFHANIKNYRLPISVCKLLYDQLLPNQTSGKFEFVNITDEKLFRIFEKFIYNFYKKNINKSIYTGVKKERLGWQETSFEGGIEDFLPTLETDVSLFNSEKKLVIECKFYETAIKTRSFGEGSKKSSFIAAHINQLFVYLKNLELRDKSILSGMIIYPENGEKIDSIYNIQGYRVSINTIDLNMNPQGIDNQLIQFLERFKIL